MEEKENFGKFIREKRNEIGLTQKEMATKLFVTESAVSKWERGLSYPDITLVRALCEVLKITEHELLTASEDTRTRRSEMLACKGIKLNFLLCSLLKLLGFLKKAFHKMAFFIGTQISIPRY